MLKFSQKGWKQKITSKLRSHDITVNIFFVYAKHLFFNSTFIVELIIYNYTFNRICGQEKKQL